MPGGGGAAWITLAQHHGWTTTQVTNGHDDGAPPDDPTHAARQRVITVTGHGDNGWTTPAQVYTLFISLTRTAPGAPWQVSGA
jgi:uncharacterized Rossmann fold enzyme